MKYKKPFLLIGIFGLPGVGKTTFATILSDKLLQINLSSYRYKISDWIRKKVSALNLPLTKKNIIQVGYDLKIKYGLTYWANLILKDLLSVDSDVIIIETGWGFQELTILKKRLKNRLILVALVAPMKILLRRIHNRNLAETERENKWSRTRIQDHEIDKFVKTADVIINNDLNGINHLGETCDIFIAKYFSCHGVLQDK